MKKVLVINLRYFGDALISSSLSTHIRKSWPDAKITYLVFDRVSSILEGVETIDDILTVPERPKKSDQLAFMLRHFHEFDLALVTQTGTRPSLYAAFLAKERVGFDPGVNRRNWWKRLLLTKHVQAAHASQVLLFDSLLTAAGCPKTDSFTVPQPHAELPAGVIPEGPYVVIHPTPRCTYKEWDVDKWQALIRKLADQGLKVVLTGSGAEAELAYVRKAAEGAEGCEIVAGRLSFAQTAGLVARSKAFIGPDTGTTHVAASTGVPTVTLFGPTSAAAWGPWAPGQSVPYEHKCSEGRQRRGNVILLQKQPYQQCPCGAKGCLNCDDSHSDCLKAITPDDVIAALRELQVSV